MAFPPPDRLDQETDRPFTRRNDGDIAADYIRDLIIRGELRSGERIIPDEIALELNTSRIPVREGLVALEREGWVSILPRRGTFVWGIGRQAVIDRYTLLGIIYGFVARRVIERGSDDQIAEIAIHQSRLHAASRVSDAIETYRDFLWQLLTASGSKPAEAILRMLLEFLWADALADPNRMISVQQKSAAAILKAIRDRDAEGATDAVAGLFRQIGEQVGTFLDARGVFTLEGATGKKPEQLKWRSSVSVSGDNNANFPGADRASEYVRSQILRGKFYAQQRIDQNAIGALAGVSRTTMREAMIILEREGWVTIVPHRGTFVNAFNSSTASDVYEMLGLLFAFATRSAADQLSPEEIETLLEVNGRLQATRDPEQFEATNGELLNLVVAGAHSNPLVTALRAIPTIVPGNFFVEVPGSIEAQREGMAAVCAALARRDLRVTDTAWATLMSHQARNVAAYLDPDRDVLDFADGGLP
jgi:DNA-binding GntR family transcriptional regulator